MTESEWLNSTGPAAMLAALPGIVACDGEQYPDGAGVSDRKLRLFACACVRHGDYDGNTEIESVVSRSESLADGDSVDVEDLNDDATICMTWCGVREAIDAAVLCANEPAPPKTMRARASLLRSIVGNPFRPVVLPPGPVCQTCGGYGSVGTLGGSMPCPRCATGPAKYGTGRSPCPWLTPTVLAVARSAYEERLADGRLDPVALAVLSDALEEAGCPETEAVPSPGWRRCLGCGREWEPNHRYDGCEETPRCDLGMSEAITTRRVPHPLLEHLRSGGPRYRGDWAVDLILGKE